MSYGEFSRHVVQGYSLAEPYRVGVLTANEGYLITPRVLITHSETLPPNLVEAAPLLNTTALLSTPAHLVDDIWMSGQLASLAVPRYVVPLIHGGPPNLDVTVTHTLETHMASDSLDRAAANDATLKAFESAWREESLWYRFRDDVRKGAKGVLWKGADDDQPRRIGWLARARVQLSKEIEKLRLRRKFKGIQFSWS